MRSPFVRNPKHGEGILDKQPIFEGHYMSYDEHGSPLPQSLRDPTKPLYMRASLDGYIPCVGPQSHNSGASNPKHMTCFTE